MYFHSGVGRAREAARMATCWAKLLAPALILEFRLGGWMGERMEEEEEGDGGEAGFDCFFFLMPPMRVSWGQVPRALKCSTAWRAAS